MAPKKKIVFIFISNFLPGIRIGGPLTSVKSMSDYLSDEYKFKIVTLDRDLGDTQPYRNVDINKWTKNDGIDVFYICKNVKIFRTIYTILKEADYDVIYLTSLFDFQFSIFVVFLRKIGVISKNIVLAPKGELYDEALNFKLLKKKIFLALVKKLKLYNGIFWHATDIREKEIIEKRMSVESAFIKVAGVLSNSFKQKHTPNSFIHDKPFSIIFLARISKDKNLPFAFEVLNEVKVPIIFDIFGPVEDSDIWENCKRLIERLPANIQVNYKGVLSRDLVTQTLASYDLFFLPTHAENFGHSIVESISVGTPVLISDNTPWRDLKEKQWGWDIDLSNKQAFIDAITDISFKSYEEKENLRKKIIESFFNSFSLESIVKQNKNLFRDL